MEAQQDVLDVSRILNINLSNKVDQLKAQLLAIQQPDLVQDIQWLYQSQNYQMFCRTLVPSMVPKERSLKSGGWRHENQSALLGQKGILAMLSHMVSGIAIDFARGHLNAILCGEGEDDWNNFSLLVD